MRVNLSRACICALIVSLVRLVSFGDEPGKLLEESTARWKVAEQALVHEIGVRIKSARGAMSENPTEVVADLKLLLEVVRTAPELSDADRASLRHQLEEALREAKRRATTQEALDQQHHATAAAAQERQRAIATFDSRQTKLDQLVDRFVALLDEGKEELAAQTAAAVAEAAPDSAIGASLASNAGLNRTVREALQTRVARQKAVIDTLHSVELAHVPRSDEPPIVYIDAAEWQELTLRRAKYAADVPHESQAETKIRKALDETTNIEFTEVPLAEAIAYLKDLHKIEIQLDIKSLEAAGISSDTPVTLQMKGVSLRSGLRTLLRNLDLTYTFTNEVLLITTPDIAATMVVPRVYKVADLVVGIPDVGFKGGFGNLGGGIVGQGNGNSTGMNSFGPSSTGNQGGNPFGQNGNNLF